MHVCLEKGTNNTSFGNSSETGLYHELCHKSLVYNTLTTYRKIRTAFKRNLNNIGNGSEDHKSTISSAKLSNEQSTGANAKQRHVGSNKNYYTSGKSGKRGHTVPKIS
jgi:hypothetical protein